MMTNVDFEGLNDWTDEELTEAIKSIKNIVEKRRNQKIREIVDRIEKDFEELVKVDIYPPEFEFEDYNITPEEIVGIIKDSYKEAY